MIGLLVMMVGVKSPDHVLESLDYLGMYVSFLSVLCTERFVLLYFPTFRRICDHYPAVNRLAPCMPMPGRETGVVSRSDVACASDGKCILRPWLLSLLDHSFVC